MVARKPDHQEERGAAVKTIAQGRPGISGRPVVTYLRAFFLHAELRVCWHTRLSLRPLFFSRAMIFQNSGESRREKARVCAPQASRHART
jgi:hypothetical protein